MGEISEKSVERILQEAKMEDVIENDMYLSMGELSSREWLLYRLRDVLLEHGYTPEAYRETWGKRKTDG